MKTQLSVEEVLKKAGGKQKQKGGGAKKIGSHKKSPSFQRYKAENRAAKHQERQVKKHLIKYPNDLQSQRFLDKNYGKTQAVRS